MSDMTEREAFEHFIEGIRRAEEAARVIAHSRKDERWLWVSNLINEIRIKATSLALRTVA